MRSMAIDRRRFLLGSALLVVAGAGQAAAGPAAQVYVASRRRHGGHEIAVFDERGNVYAVVPLPGRGHSFAIEPASETVVAFGRQPGFFAAVFSIETSIIDAALKAEKAPVIKPRILKPGAGRHFFGHGVFFAEATRIAATENDYDAGQGVLGIYEINQQTGQWQRTGEWSTNGIGPHEVILLPDGRTACVANGGLLTHPDYGKQVLNRDTINPSLAYIDLYTGKLLEQVFLPEHLRRLSLRHLALDAMGRVWIGGQYRGLSVDNPPLIGVHTRTEPIKFVTPPDKGLWRRMKHYVGSMAVDDSGLLVAATSPAGGVTTIWDAATGKLLHDVVLADGCGIAPAVGGGFLASTGFGRISRLSDRVHEVINADVSWDNHMRRWSKGHQTLSGYPN